MLCLSFNPVSVFNPIIWYIVINFLIIITNIRYMFVELYAKFGGQVEKIHKPNLMLEYIFMIYEDRLYIKLPYPTWLSNYYCLE